jgi:hypothetical protein
LSAETDARIDELAIAVEQIRRAVVQMADAIAPHHVEELSKPRE